MVNLALDYVEKLRVNAERERFRALILKRDDSFKQRMYRDSNKMKSVIFNLDQGQYVDLYCSLNTFVKPRRTTENICQLEHLYIDLDCYKKGITKEAALYFLENDHFNIDIPIPNMIINSGKGLYLIWNIRPVPIRALPLWAALQRYFFETLKYLGADPRCLDAARFLRVPGTTNSSNGNLVHIIHEYDYRYELQELKEGYLNEIEKRSTDNKKRNKIVKNVLHFYNGYTLNRARIHDILKLCELRGYDLEGYRETILFLYRYFNCIDLDDEEKALEEAIELNEMFLKPLKEKEVLEATQSAENYYKEHKYNYTNAKLIEILDITEEEQKSLTTIISRKEKYSRNNEKRRAARRDEDGLTKRQRELKELKENIGKLKTQGLTQIRISKELNVSVRCIKYNW